MNFNDFTRIYSPQPKTLRFEARPVGATLRNFIANGLLERDEHRAESYVRVKKLMGLPLNAYTLIVKSI